MRLDFLLFYRYWKIWLKLVLEKPEDSQISNLTSDYLAREEWTLRSDDLSRPLQTHLDLLGKQLKARGKHSTLFSPLVGDGGDGVGEAEIMKTSQQDSRLCKPVGYWLYTVGFE